MKIDESGFENSPNSPKGLCFDVFIVLKLFTYCLFGLYLSFFFWPRILIFNELNFEFSLYFIRFEKKLIRCKNIDRSEEIAIDRFAEMVMGF